MSSRVAFIDFSLQLSASIVVCLLFMAFVYAVPRYALLARLPYKMKRSYVHASISIACIYIRFGIRPPVFIPQEIHRFHVRATPCSSLSFVAMWTIPFILSQCLVGLILFLRIASVMIIKISIDLSRMIQLAYVWLHRGPANKHIYSYIINVKKLITVWC